MLNRCATGRFCRGSGWRVPRGFFAGPFVAAQAKAMLLHAHAAHEHAAEIPESGHEPVVLPVQFDSPLVEETGNGSTWLAQSFVSAFDGYPGLVRVPARVT
jgi:hypothetical protein